MAAKGLMVARGTSLALASSASLGRKPKQRLAVEECQSSALGGTPALGRLTTGAGAGEGRR
jgi:hypothetical protein